MNEQGTEPERWSARTSARLKLIQASCRDWAPDKRRAALVQEFEEALKEIPSGHRPRYLKSLASQFPSFPQLGSPPPGSPPQATEAEESPEHLLDKFLICCSLLPPEKREYFSSCLEESGLLNPAPPAPAVPAEAIGEELKPYLKLTGPDLAGIQLTLESLRLFLNLDPDQPIDLFRAFRLLRWLLEGVAALDEFIWRVWREMAPSSSLAQELHHGQGDLLKAAAGYLKPGGSTDGTQCSQSIDAAVWLIRSLITGLARGGKQFCEEVYGYVSPNAVLQEVKKRGGLVLQGEGSRCWEEYEQRFDRIDPDYLERWLRARVAEIGEAWFRVERENA